MKNLDPQILLMGWLFAQNAFWARPDNLGDYLMDLNTVLLKTSDGFYLIPKTEV